MGQSSVRKGAAGRPAALTKLGVAVSCQAKRAATGWGTAG